VTIVLLVGTIFGAPVSSDVVDTVKADGQGKSLLKMHKATTRFNLANADWVTKWVKNELLSYAS
jgi:hypothetical protein